MKCIICISLLHWAEQKEGFWGGYFACCFDCCKTWTCQCLTDLFVLVQYLLGHKVCSRFSALWNLFKSSNLSSDDLKSDDHLYSVWKNYSTVDFRSATTCVAFFVGFCGFFFFVLIIIAKLLLRSAKMPRSISSQVYCYRLLQKTD